MTSTFAPLLINSPNPRLVFVTSGLSTLEGCSHSLMPFHKVNIPAGWPKPPGQSAVAYRSTKTALNMLMLYWHWTLENDGVKTWCISPGFLATNLGGDRLKKLGAGDPALGGQFIRQVIDGERDQDAGKVITSSGLQPW
jgi:NAD(P)-dependent dehydrogenase (short-subunit alcohol dehydrogenase family)